MECSVKPVSCSVAEYSVKPVLYKVRSQEVEMGQIFLLNIFNENGKVPSDIPSDTKKSIRVVH